jgi:HSP20 family molecular chaperone IbpA
VAQHLLKKIAKKSKSWTSFKNRNAVPTAFGSVLDQPVNIRKTTESYELEKPAPGLLKSEIRLNIDSDTLTFSVGQPGDRLSRGLRRGQKWNIRFSFSSRNSHIIQHH